MPRDVDEKYFELNGHRAPSDVSGKLPGFRSPSGLEDVVAAFDELLLLPDHGAVHVALAGVVANYADGDPVWPLLVGPPGSGKTEIINSITSAPGVWALSSLTPQTLLSGFERKGEPASLLLQIGDFGIRPFHDARHTSLTHMAANGSSPVAIMATAGHASMATTSRYLHLAGVTFSDEAAALERRLLGQGGTIRIR